jgi:hypothetical protein
VLPDDGCKTETCRSAFNVNFNVNFNIHLEQYRCAFSLINKRLDNTKMYGTNVKNKNKFVLSGFLTFESGAIGFYKISYTGTVVLNNLLTFCHISPIFTVNGSGISCTGN